MIDPVTWRQQRAVEDASAVSAEDASTPRTGSPLEHVFTVLGLVLPPEPLRIALQTALEYRESILPADVRAQLWPLLENAPASTEESAAPVPARPARSNSELLAALRVG